MTGPSRDDRDASAHSLTFITREGCHLCETAEPIVRDEAAAAGAVLEIVDVDSSAALHERWRYDVPVVLLDGEVHARWTVDRAELRAALRPAETQRASLWQRLLGRRG